MSDESLVSICIPTYNRAAFIGATLESLLHQTFPDIEILLCDDGSTDDTWSVVEGFAERGVRLFRNDTNVGLARTLERLFSEARGAFIGMQHDHDLYAPTFVQTLVDLMREHRSAVFGFSAYSVLAGEATVAPVLPEHTLFGSSALISGTRILKLLAEHEHTNIAAMSVIVRRTALLKAGGYSSDWGLASDEDLYRRLARVGDAVFAKERLLAIRYRPADRHAVHGSWRAIHTLSAFRSDVVTRDLSLKPLAQARLLTRIGLRRRRALLREAVHLKLWSESDRLAEVEAPVTIRGINVAHVPSSIKIVLVLLDWVPARVWVFLRRVSGRKKS